MIELLTGIEKVGVDACRAGLGTKNGPNTSQSAADERSKESSL